MTSHLTTALYWLFSNFLTLVGFLLALIFLADLLRQRRSPTSTLAWLMAILLIPYVGVPLYLLLGGRKLRRMAGRKSPIYHAAGTSADDATSLARLLNWYGLPGAKPGNKVELVSSGVEAFDRILKMIDQAHSTIDITTYILGLDQGGQELVDRLASRAAAGVRVRLLVDGVGSWRVRRSNVKPLTDAGGETAFFMPMLRLPFRGRPNLRNHRKLIVIDGRLALAGGMNLAWPYIGRTPEGLWQDVSLVVEGPVVSDLAAIFTSDWAFATKSRPTPPTPPVAREIPLSAENRGVVQVVASGPDVAGDPLYEAILLLIFSARKRIWIVTPYYVPDEMLSKALVLAARRGVDTRLIIPAHSNHLTADLARASYIRDLHNAGGKVLLYTPEMLHAKAVVLDDSLAMIGSANMDMRSLFLNYELALFVSSAREIDAIALWTEELATRATPELPLAGWGRVLAENVVRLLSPLL